MAIPVVHPFYEIGVRGVLAGALLAAFPTLGATARGANTVLSGELADQAALHGVLAQIESLGLELISVHQVHAVAKTPRCVGDRNNAGTNRLSPTTKGLTSVATEVTEGAQGMVAAVQRLTDQSLTVEDRFTSDFTDHDPAVGQPDGAAGPAWFWEQFEKSFSDLDRDLIETVITPTKMITVMNLSGTHTGNYRGHPPTRKRFTVRNVQVMGFRDGKACDRWGSTDELGILRQLGLA
jgi:predicted ester cyclase